jgi:hypothetical protein
MKKLFALLIALFLLSGCAATTMIAPERQPNLTPSPEKATVVIIRDTLFGGVIVFWHYVDGKFIGETQGNTYIVAHVDPGKRYLLVDTENTAVAQIDFKPSRVYYLREGVIMGWWRARTSGFSPLSKQEAEEAMRNCTYWEINPEAEIADMDPDHYAQAIADYHEEVKQNPEGFEAILKYQGYLY